MTALRPAVRIGPAERKNTSLHVLNKHIKIRHCHGFPPYSGVRTLAGPGAAAAPRAPPRLPRHLGPRSPSQSGRNERFTRACETSVRGACASRVSELRNVL